MLLHSPVSIEDALPKIIDAPLTLISKMWQGPCHLPFCQSRRPILHLWIDATMQPFDCWMGMTVNHWCSVDTHLWAHYRDTLTVIECSTIVPKMHIIIIGSQYTVSMYHHLNPKALSPPSIWATTRHIIWVMNDVGCDGGGLVLVAMVTAVMS
jgi:hypothetical protein